MENENQEVISEIESSDGKKLYPVWLQDERVKNQFHTQRKILKLKTTEYMKKLLGE